MSRLNFEEYLRKLLQSISNHIPLLTCDVSSPIGVSVICSSVGTVSAEASAALSFLHLDPQGWPLRSADSQRFSARPVRLVHRSRRTGRSCQQTFDIAPGSSGSSFGRITDAATNTRATRARPQRRRSHGRSISHTIVRIITRAITVGAETSLRDLSGSHDFKEFFTMIFSKIWFLICVSANL